VRKGQYNAVAPADQDFERAGEWRIQLPSNPLQGLHDVFLRIHYAGDVARLYSGSHLLDDDFFHGGIWEVGVRRFAPEIAVSGLVLKILPLREDASIFIPHDAWPKFPPSREIANVWQVTADPEYEIRVNFGSNASSGRD
jgi:hypothetical protein